VLNKYIALALLLLVGVFPSARAQERPLRLAIAGLVHGHVSGFLRAARARPDVQLVGIYDPSVSLQRKYGETFKLPSEIFFSDLATMLDRVKPDAVASFTSTLDHPMVVETAATRHIAVMMEKPLAVSVADAQRIQRAAARAGVPVFVNYETTWYPNHTAIRNMFKEKNATGEIRKMVALDGHQGPKRINVQPEFFDWLTDPVKNGAGALFDFGCYGANLMTWLMDGRRPIAVTAVTQQFQPETYPHVDDEATILLEYPGALGIIEASWNWPANRKDLEVYGERAYAVATTGGGSLRTGAPTGAEHTVTPAALPADEKDSISHLIAVARGTRKPNALSSLENNLVVTEILEAARESAHTHRRVPLAKR
jgi:scyllo-inositol 2-dehydrogenase (NADP+)